MKLLNEAKLCPPCFKTFYIHKKKLFRDNAVELFGLSW